MDKMASSTTARHRAERGSRGNRGLTCANCRVRKTRCDGSQPSCKTCEVYKDECRYEKPPPMSQVIAMAKRLQEVERSNAELEQALQRERETRQTPLRQSIEPPLETPRSNIPLSPRISTVGAYPENKPSSSPSGSSVDANLLSDLSLDENGKLCYYGPTSAVHAPPVLQNTDSSVQEEYSAKYKVRSALASSALESRAWEEFAMANAALQTSIPQHIISKLVQIHWTWIAPMFMWVYRPAFMRDMAMAGPYYSPFLLTVLCAHAARFDDSRLSDALISRARLLLGNEIHQASSIPTAQALLQLSARDLAYGSISQAWLYSGMAFRMVSDLGLHHSTGRIAKVGGLHPQDLEIRRRLFWSCYFWDKAISLYLGRTPVLQDLPSDHTPEFLDDSAEYENWSPHCGGAINLSKVPVSEYPPMKAHLISCFENSCKLAVLLNDIIMAFYSKHTATNAERALAEIRDKLTKWREESPSHLKYDPDNLPESCPPPHILTQNLLYYTTVILLHRPFYSIPAHHNTCRLASNNIEKLLLLLDKTFGFTRVTYLMSYCIYTGASVITQDAKSGDIDATLKMQTFLRALRQGITTCPILQRSLDIITKNFREEDTAASASCNKDGNIAAQGLCSRNYLPAFPYRDLEMMDVQDMSQGRSMDFEGLSFLDSFPETLFDHVNTTEDWLLPP